MRQTHDEEHERMLEPHREEEQRNARREAADRLRDRKIPLYSSDSDDEVADLLEAIERFESIVETQGGDLHVNRIGASEPQDAAFIPPVRGQHESASAYRERILSAAAALNQRQRAD